MSKPPPIIDADATWVRQPASHSASIFRGLITHARPNPRTSNNPRHAGGTSYEQRWHAWGREQQKRYAKPQPRPSSVRFHHVSDDYWRVTNRPSNYRSGANFQPRQTSVMGKLFLVVGWAFIISTIYLYITREAPQIREERELAHWLAANKEQAKNYQLHCIDNGANNKKHNTLEPWEVYAGCKGK